jgi:hypothetical protein
MISLYEIFSDTAPTTINYPGMKKENSETSIHTHGKKKKKIISEYSNSFFDGMANKNKQDYIYNNHESEKLGTPAQKTEYANKREIALRNLPRVENLRKREEENRKTRILNKVNKPFYFAQNKPV